MRSGGQAEGWPIQIRDEKILAVSVRMNIH